MSKAYLWNKNLEIKYVCRRQKHFQTRVCKHHWLGHMGIKFEKSVNFWQCKIVNENTWSLVTEEENFADIEGIQKPVHAAGTSPLKLYLSSKKN